MTRQANKRAFSLLALGLVVAACSPGGAVNLPATETSVARAVMTQLASTSHAQAQATPSPPAPGMATAQLPPPARPTPLGTAAPPPIVSTQGHSVRLEITGRYLMALHACDRAAAECRDPRHHQIYLAQSDDSAQWSIVPGWQPYRGSVPDVIRRGNTVYIFHPNQVARYNLDTKTFDGPMAVTLEGTEPGGFVDPSLFVDDQGRLVLFFLHGRIGGNPAACPPGQSTCAQRIGSATEVEGSNGTAFALDDGDRVSLQLSSGGPIRSASDPDIFFDGAQYVLYISHGPSFSVWTSGDLRGRYAQAAALLANNYGVPSGYFDPMSQRYWSFAHRAWQGGPTLIYRAVHPTFTRQLGQDDWAVLVSGESLGLGGDVNVESPGFAVNTP